MFFPIIPALDKMSLRRALNLVNDLHKEVLAFKVHAVADYMLRFILNEFKNEGAQGLLVDYKLHDMPDTVAECAAAIKAAGATMLTVHAEGRPEMIAAAVKNGPEIIFCVTKLTSLTDEEIEHDHNRPVLEVLTERALWAVEGGAHGIVCSARHVGALAKNEKLKKLLLLVPGTRSAGFHPHDQKQVNTPYEAALKGGKNVILVGGRQITHAESPRGALHAMGSEILTAWRALDSSSGS